MPSVKRVLGYLAAVLGVLVLSVPLAFVGTFLLLPLWRWIEATYQIESVGHSGPADWCFELIYTLLVILCLGALWLIRRKSHQAGT